MATEEPQNSGQRPRLKRGCRHQLMLWAGLVVIAAVSLWWQQRSTASLQDTYAVMRAQLSQMRQDAARIKTLRQAPRLALSRARANEELLAQVEAALARAGVDRTHWRSSVPQPPSRIGQTDYKRHTTRLLFEDLSLEQLASFVWQLQTDPTLRVSALSLTTRADSIHDYDADVSIAYLEYAPTESKRGHETARQSSVLSGGRRPAVPGRS